MIEEKLCKVNNRENEEEDEENDDETSVLLNLPDEA